MRRDHGATDARKCRKWAACLKIVVVLLALPVRSGAGVEQGATEWGAVSFEALCLAGMPSAECSDAQSFGAKKSPDPDEQDRPAQATVHHTPTPPPPPSPPDPAVLATKATPKTAQYSIAVPGHRQVACHVH